MPEIVVVKQKNTGRRNKGKKKRGNEEGGDLGDIVLLFFFIF